MNQQVADLGKELLIVLEEQVRHYRGLLDTVRREKEILIASQLDELNENNRAKEAVLIKIRDLEDRRIRSAAALATALNLHEESPRLQELARVAGGEMGDRLRNFHSVLELLLKRVQELNKENETLVKSALQHVTGAMKEIRDTLKEKPTYQRRGEVSTGSGSTGHLVSREA